MRFSVTSASRRQPLLAWRMVLGSSSRSLMLYSRRGCSRIQILRTLFRSLCARGWCTTNARASFTLSRSFLRRSPEKFSDIFYAIRRGKNKLRPRPVSPVPGRGTRIASKEAFSTCLISSGLGVAQSNLLSRASYRLIGISNPGAANERKRGDFVRLCARGADDVLDGNFSYRKRVGDK